MSPPLEAHFATCRELKRVSYLDVCDPDFSAMLNRMLDEGYAPVVSSSFMESVWKHDALEVTIRIFIYGLFAKQEVLIGSPM